MATRIGFVEEYYEGRKEILLIIDPPYGKLVISDITDPDIRHMADMFGKGRGEWSIQQTGCWTSLEIAGGENLKNLKITVRMEPDGNHMSYSIPLEQVEFTATY